MTIKRIAHIAIAVKDLDKSRRFWEEILGLTVQEVRSVPEQAVKVAFLPIGESEVELVQPLTEDSTVARWIKKYGPGIHHVCLEVDDIHQTLSDLAARGVALIDKEPRTGADGKLYAFVHPKSTGGILVEFYQLPEA